MDKVLVIGSINEDITLFMDEIPVGGETVIANDMASSLGGKGANQAITLARMGADVDFIGAVGSGKSAEVIIDLLKKDNLGVSGIKQTDTNTGSAYISIDKSGENSIIVYPGANFAITKDQLYENIDLFKEAKYCLMQLEVPIEIIKEAIKICKEEDVEVLLNPAPYHKDVDDYILSNIDYYIPNETEFLHTIDFDVNEDYDLDFFKEKGLEFSSKYNLNVVITLGSEGALLIKDNSTVLIPAQKVTPVDTTAAGDSFIGGFLSALSNNVSLEEALDFGSRVAAITICKVGAISAIPYRDEVI